MACRQDLAHWGEMLGKLVIKEYVLNLLQLKGVMR